MKKAKNYLNKSMKRIIIAGGRDFKDTDFLNKKVEEVLTPYANLSINDKEATISYNCTILSGLAKGADDAGLRFARERSIKTVEYPAHWGDVEGKPPNEVKQGKYGKYWVKAGPHRNQQMADNADMLIAFWDGKSTGTKDMIKRATLNKLETHIFYYG